MIIRARKVDEIGTREFLKGQLSLFENEKEAMGEGIGKVENWAWWRKPGQKQDGDIVEEQAGET